VDKSYAMKIKLCIRIIIGCLFIGAGIAHFTNADFFSTLVPALLSAHKDLFNVTTGILQVGIGIAFLLPQLHMLARWSAIVLLVITLPSAIDQVIHSEVIRSVGLSPSLALFRVFVQVGMIGLIWWISRPENNRLTPPKLS